MLDCFNPNLAQIWTNPNVGLKISQKVEVGLKLNFLPNIWVCPYLTQMLGSNNPAFFRVYFYFGKTFSSLYSKVLNRTVLLDLKTCCSSKFELKKWK